MRTLEVVEAIENGALDSGLREIVDAIHERRDLLGRRKHRMFGIGDIVRFVNLGMGAKYMNGLRARIVEINPKTVWVELLPEDRALIRNKRLGRASRIKVYPNSLEFAFVEGHAEEPYPKLPKNVTPVDGYEVIEDTGKS